MALEDFSRLDKCVSANFHFTNVEIYHLLLSLPLDLLQQDKHGKTLFSKIFANEDFDLKDGEGSSALMTACRYNQPEVAKLLIEKGAKIDLQNKDGDSSLIIACEYDQAEVPKLLVERGANLDLQNKGGESALMFACFKNQPEVAKLLVE